MSLTTIGSLIDCSRRITFYFYKLLRSLVVSINLFCINLNSASVLRVLSFRLLYFSFKSFNLFSSSLAFRYSSALSMTLLKLGNCVMRMIFSSKIRFCALIFSY